jgi:hypothetical protein
MPTVEELLKLAKEHYAQARSTRDTKAKWKLIRLGNQYLREAVQVQRDQVGSQSAPPNE